MTQKEFVNNELWDSHKELNDEREFLKFDDDGCIECIFEENNFEVLPTKFGNTINMFKVIDLAGNKALFSTGSKRCMHELHKLLPLENKRINIKREGQAFDTVYTLIEVK